MLAPATLNLNGNSPREAPAPRPIPSVNFDQIPAVLKDARAWCVWRYELRPDKSGAPKPTKVPLRPYSLTGAKSNRPETWDWLTCAAEVFRGRAPHRGLHGVGFFLHDDFVGVDLDNVRDPATGTIDPTAFDVIRSLDSYTEVSPSGRGIRIFLRGKLPSRDRRNGPYEVYDASSPRFLTVTGDHIEGTPPAVEERQAALDAFHRQHIARPERAQLQTAAAATPSTSPAAVATSTPRGGHTPRGLRRVWSKAMEDPATAALWRGEWQGQYPSQSEADCALCVDLFRFAGPFPETVDALFRRSGLFRPKWDDPRGPLTYGERTLERAADGVRFYDWGCLVDDVCTPWPDALPDLPRSPRKRPGLTASDIFKLPAPQWLVRRHLCRQSLTVIAGPPGHGKSYFALRLALDAALGEPFLGEFKTPRPIKIAYIYSEGQSGIQYRLRAWQAATGFVTAPDSIRWYPYRYDFLSDDDVRTFLADIVEDFGGLPDLIILDTLARNFGPGDENSTKDMGQFVAGTDACREAGAAVVVIHHTGKDQSRGERGSSALRAAADNVFLVHRPDEDSPMEIRCEKMKDGTPFAAYLVEFESHALGLDPDGEEITAASLSYAGTVKEGKAADEADDLAGKVARLTLPTTAEAAAAVWGVKCKKTARGWLNKAVAAGLLAMRPGCLTTFPKTPDTWGLPSGNSPMDSPTSGNASGNDSSKLQNKDLRRNAT